MTQRERHLRWFRLLARSHYRWREQGQRHFGGETLSELLHEPAAGDTAGYLRRLLGIVLPLHRRGLLGAFLLTFIFCLRDLETAVLFYPPGGEPRTVRLFTLEANGPESVVAALAWVQILIAAAATAGMALIYKAGRT